MKRGDALVPITSPFSMTCTSNGDAIASQPAATAAVLGSENTTDDATPASVVTCRSSEPVSPTTVTRWRLALSSPTVTGDVPRTSPSIDTRAPGGSVITVSVDVNAAGAGVGANS